MWNPKITVILPTLGRAEQCVATIHRFLDTAIDEIEIIVITEEKSTQELLVHEPVTTLFLGGTPVSKWNEGAKIAHTDYFLLAADDLWPHDLWLKQAFNSPQQDFVGFNDLHTPAAKNRSTHYLLSRKFCKLVLGGVFCPPMYKVWGFDVEVSERAEMAGCYQMLENAVLEHRHHQWGDSEFDSTYQKSQPLRQADMKLREARKEKGYPTDYIGFL